MSDYICLHYRGSTDDSEPKRNVTSTKPTNTDPPKPQKPYSFQVKGWPPPPPLSQVHGLPRHCGQTPGGADTHAPPGPWRNGRSKPQPSGAIAAQWPRRRAAGARAESRDVWVVYLHSCGRLPCWCYWRSGPVEAGRNAAIVSGVEVFFTPSLVSGQIEASGVVLRAAGGTRGRRS